MTSLPQIISWKRIYFIFFCQLIIIFSLLMHCVFPNMWSLSSTGTNLPSFFQNSSDFSAAYVVMLNANADYVRVWYVNKFKPIVYIALMLCHIRLIRSSVCARNSWRNKLLVLIKRIVIVDILYHTPNSWLYSVSCSELLTMHIIKCY